jgi:alcohol dehydrogenase class IV
MRFEFATATRIVFGAGARRGLPEIVATLGGLNATPARRVLLVSGRAGDRAAPIAASLEERGLSVVPWSVFGEPTVDDVVAGRGFARGQKCDVVLAVGGGSAIDAGKAVAALATNDRDPLDYLEVIGSGRPLERAPLPFVAVPTTAGSGAEVTKNAVLTASDRGVKVSLRSPLMLPAAAVVDPELTYGLPPPVTAATGLDALAQLVEPYLSGRASALVDPWCLDGIGRVARSLPAAFRDGRDAAARADMSLASLMGGLALANAGLGAVHGFAGPIGGRFTAPHGAVCAALLPHAFRVNVAAMAARGADGGRLGRADRVAQALTGRADARAADAVERLEALREELNVPRLAAYGIGRHDVGDLVAQARQSSSMKANPVALTDEELMEILTSAL